MSLNKIFAWLERIARHKTAMWVLSAVLAMGIRVAILPVLPMPQPGVHDEFSYLLGAETFASGRVTNPPHPMWMHFETFHELMQPTYMTKYPPGQSLFMALGWKLFGHPWLGVVLSFGFFYGCLCWMLQNWMPPVYAVFGTVMTFTHISVFSYWINSYWGGAVAAGAGCLLLGTLPRLSRRVKSLDIALAALGLVLLANSRPYEGLVMSIAAFVALLYWRRRQKRKLPELMALRSVLPFVLVLGTGAALDCYYNYRVTGHALRMPYVEYSHNYVIAPSFVFLPELRPPTYHNAEIENWFLAGPDIENYRNERWDIPRKLAALSQPLHFYLSFLLVFPILAGVFLSGSFRVRIAIAILLCLWFGFLLINGLLPHYVAGGVGLLAVLAAYGLRVLRMASNKYGRSLVLILVILMCVQLTSRQAFERSMAGSLRHFTPPRTVVTNICRSNGDRHLIFVRYSPNHDFNHEYVYNSADIDSSFIVWARDRGTENQELIDYYKSSRKVWLWQADIEPAALTPYNTKASGPSTNTSGQVARP